MPWQNKSQQMSQKFILSASKTAKKEAHFEQQRPKRFARKRSERDHSFDSKRSREDSICSQYIKNPSRPELLKRALNHDDSFHFTDELNTSALLGNQPDRRQRKTMVVRGGDVTREECTLALKIKILETQMRAKEGECQRFRMQAEEERDRRRRAEIDRKSAMRESAAFQKQNEELMLQLKKLNKEKEILNKQIEFLQKINYDDKTRTIQSFREKHLQEEVLKLREKLQERKGKTEVQQEEEIGKLRQQKQATQQRFRSMESLVAVLRRTVAQLKEDISEERLLTKERIVNSEEYRELRERFKRFIDQYKEVRTQNSSLKAVLEGKEAELVLSESQSESH